MFILSILFFVDAVAVFLHFNELSQQLAYVVENKVKADSISVLAHLYLRGNMAHLISHAESYLDLGLSCFSILDIENRIIFGGKSICDTEVLALNYVGQEVLKIRYTLPTPAIIRVLWDIRYILFLSGIGKLALLALWRLTFLSVRAEEKAKTEAYRLRMAEKAVKMLAHDVRQPFLMIKAFIAILERQIDDKNLPELIAKCGSEIKGASEQMETLVAQILNFDKDLPPKIAPFNLAQALSTAKAIAFKAQKMNISLEEKLEHKSAVLADESQIVRVLVNLLINASEVFGVKTIRIESKDIYHTHLVELCVRNDGLPIDINDVERVFEPFFTRKKGKGIGLGLAICRDILEQNKGEIFCRLQHKQSEFVIRLPASSNNAKA